MSHFLLIPLGLLILLAFWGYVYLIYRVARHLLQKYGLQNDLRWWLVAVVAGLFLILFTTAILNVLILGREFSEEIVDGLDSFLDALLVLAMIVGIFVTGALVGHKEHEIAALTLTIITMVAGLFATMRLPVSTLIALTIVVGVFTIGAKKW